MHFSREIVYEEFKNHNIFARRYFYPLISNMPSYRSLPSAAKENLPVANLIAENILCLPIYGKLGGESISKIYNTLNNI